MTRRIITAALVVAAAIFLDIGIEAAALASTVLLLPQSSAFSVLGHSCGGIQEQVLGSGFDARGYPTGDVYLQTRCGGSGRGGGYHVTTYSAWVGATWDYTGAVLAFQTLATPPAGLDPTFFAFDSFGNEIYNVLNAVNVLPANCTVGNTTYCSYRAYLSLAPNFVPPPRVTTLSVTSGSAAGGTTVTVTGTGFTGATGVSFGATPAASFAVNSDTSITALSPAASPDTVDVTVTTAGGTSAVSSSDEFTFIGAAVVSGISPDSGTTYGGTMVTISGTGFTYATGVSFGEDPAGFWVNDDSSISAVSPAAEATDTVHVTVVSAGGTSLRTAADRFTYTLLPVPIIQCTRLRGTLSRAMIVSGCTPASGTNRRAALPAQSDTFVWAWSGETTIVSLGGFSPGQGACRFDSIEYDISGTVVGGTSTYTTLGDTISARTCISPSGRLSLVRGTPFSF